MPNVTVDQPKVVSRAGWLAARIEHLKKEKELTRIGDELSRERRELPWVKVDKNYVFDTPSGKQTLSDLFGGRSQLIVYHFMFGPGWKEGCVGCSFTMDHIDGAVVHLEHHDVSFVAVSRAPLPELSAYQKRMGWRFKWISSFGSDFNYDYHVSVRPEELAKGEVEYNFRNVPARGEEMSGVSAFYKNQAGEIFHTYSTYARGGEKMLGTYMLLDIAPKGRNESDTNGNLTGWVRHHDNYDGGGHVDNTGRYVPPASKESGCNCEKQLSARTTNPSKPGLNRRE
jgi:predicted dithiol-disulfide oxidoreductase (DUF899 family)